MFILDILRDVPGTFWESTHFRYQRPWKCLFKSTRHWTWTPKQLINLQQQQLQGNSVSESSFLRFSHSHITRVLFKIESLLGCPRPLVLDAPVHGNVSSKAQGIEKQSSSSIWLLNLTISNFDKLITQTKKHLTSHTGPT
jgi:hypothetical protein